MRLALLFLLVIPAAPAVAQVGHEPSKSPYRDILYDQSLTAYASYFDGGGGTLGIGVHDGWMYGIRYQLRANRFISFGLGVSYGPDLKRNVVDPFAEDTADRITGPVQIRVWIPEALLQFNFTANKTLASHCALRRHRPRRRVLVDGAERLHLPEQRALRLHALRRHPDLPRQRRGAAARGPHAAVQDLAIPTSTTTASSRSSAPAASGSPRAGSWPGSSFNFKLSK